MRTLNIFALTFIAFTLFLTITTQNVHATSTESLLQEKKADRLSAPNDIQKLIPILPPLTEKEQENAKVSTDTLLNNMALDFIIKNRDKIKDVGSWSACYKKCMINNCCYCDGSGVCKDPPCESADNCPSCSGSCTVDPGRSGDFCAEDCGGNCIF